MNEVIGLCSPGYSHLLMFMCWWALGPAGNLRRGSCVLYIAIKSCQQFVLASRIRLAVVNTAKFGERGPLPLQTRASERRSPQVTDVKCKCERAPGSWLLAVPVKWIPGHTISKGRKRKLPAFSFPSLRLPLVRSSDSSEASNTQFARLLTLFYTIAYSLSLSLSRRGTHCVSNKLMLSLSPHEKTSKGNEKMTSDQRVITSNYWLTPIATCITWLKAERRAPVECEA